MSEARDKIIELIMDDSGKAADAFIKLQKEFIEAEKEIAGLKKTIEIDAEVINDKDAELQLLAGKLLEAARYLNNTGGWEKFVDECRELANQFINKEG